MYMLKTYIFLYNFIEEENVIIMRGEKMSGFLKVKVCDIQVGLERSKQIGKIKYVSLVNVQGEDYLDEDKVN